MIRPIKKCFSVILISVVIFSTKNITLHGGKMSQSETYSAAKISVATGTAATYALWGNPYIPYIIASIIGGGMSQWIKKRGLKFYTNKTTDRFSEAYNIICKSWAKKSMELEYLATLPIETAKLLYATTSSIWLAFCTTTACCFSIVQNTIAQFVDITNNKELMEHFLKNYLLYMRLSNELTKIKTSTTPDYTQLEQLFEPEAIEELKTYIQQEQAEIQRCCNKLLSQNSLTKDEIIFLELILPTHGVETTLNKGGCVYVFDLLLQYYKKRQPL
jgi:hypothetical protein